MRQIRLLFIDEEQESLEEFVRYIDNSTRKAEVELITSLPKASLDEMIDFIIYNSIDALITDFSLNDMIEGVGYNVPYNGVELVEQFQSIRKQFPCFVLTALDDEAIDESKDVNIVYVKNILVEHHEENVKADFLDRVISQVQHYRNRISEAEQELSKLIQERNNGSDVTMEMETRILELDDFLENTIDRRSAVPTEYKKLSNVSRLEELIKKVDNLLSKLKDDSDNKTV